MGRHTEYKKEYCQDVKTYIKECGDKELPTVEGFALRLDVVKKTIYNWSDQQKDFLHALGGLKNEQCKRLINNGLLGKYNSTIAKLILSANHGMREGTDVTSGGEKLPTPIYGGKATI